MADEWMTGIEGLIFRGSRVNDVTNTSASGFLQVAVAILSASALSVPVVGEILTDGDGAIDSVEATLREIIEVETMTYHKSKAIAEILGIMDGGRIRKLIRLLSLPCVWIYRAYEDLSDTSGSYLLRSIINPDWDETDDNPPEFTDEYWRAADPGQLPMRVQWDFQAREEHTGGGLYEFRPKLYKVAVEDSL